jgi:hypothetical protein
MKSDYFLIDAADGTVKAGKENVIIITSGVELDLLDPIPEMINVNDIARSLSFQCRFGGHINRFLSVAQHSVMVAAMAPPELRKYALLYNAYKAYLQDISAQLRSILGPAYKILQDRFMKVIAVRFELNPDTFSEVQLYDVRAAEIEYNAFKEGKLHEWQAECLSLKIPTVVYGAEHSESFFMSTFYSIFGSSYIN